MSSDYHYVNTSFASVKHQSGFLIHAVSQAKLDLIVNVRIVYFCACIIVSSKLV